MPYILRSDAAKGYVSAPRAPQIHNTMVPRASFLGVPLEVRMQIYRQLFAKMVLEVWYHLRPRFELHMNCFATAVVRALR